MKLNRALRSIIVLFVFVMISSVLKAQSVDRNCGDIIIETKTFPPDSGKKNGRIQISIPETSKKYKVFLLNAGTERAKREIENGIIDNLQTGFYDILVIDEKGCNKQITVDLK